MQTEAILIGILEEVVGTKQLTAEARFLDIGGNSLNLVEVLKQIRARTGVSPSPRIFFDKTRSTVAALAAEIDALREARQAETSAGS